jgi:surface polysaccharide O-acyltransferase-like enzyme
VYAVGYLISSISVFAVGIVLLFVDAKIGKLGGYATNWYSYNSLPVLFGSICLFLAFLKMEIKKEWISKCINVIAGATFGVYLIHEHRYLRYVWQQWLGVEQYVDGPWMILHLLVSVTLVFAVCACVELVRKTIFTWLTGRKWVNQIFGRFAGVENKINGDS